MQLWDNNKKNPDAMERREETHGSSVDFPSLLFRALCTIGCWKKRTVQCFATIGALMLVGAFFFLTRARGTTKIVQRKVLIEELRERVNGCVGFGVENSILLRQADTIDRLRVKRQRQRRSCIPGCLPWITLAVLLIGTSVGSSCCSALMAVRLPLFTTRGLPRCKVSSANHNALQLFAAGINGSGLAAAPTTTRKEGFQPLSTNATGNHFNNGVLVHEIELALSDGMILRGQRWCTQQQQGDGVEMNGGSTPTTTKILALHGWLDNCRSFYCLAPKLLEEFSRKNRPAEFVAIDLPGHGLSPHRPVNGPSVVLSEGTYYISEAIDALGWEGATTTTTSSKNGGAADTDDDDDEYEYENTGISLIGHSMGGSLAVLYAGAFPEQVAKVVSLDIYGPEPADPCQAAANIRSHVLMRKQGPRPHVLYPSLERAIERRQKAATLSRGGKQYISKEAATELVTRAMEPVYETNTNTTTSSSSSSSEEEDNAQPRIAGFKFVHDAKLMWPSLQYMSKEQIQSVLEAVQCPVCILAAEDGYPFDQDRIDRVVQALNPRIHKTLPGSHHLHADPDTADAVVDAIFSFLEKSHNDQAKESKQQ